MSSYKILKTNCTHPNGYLNKTNRCPDCNALAAPSVQIEELHQKMLKGYIAEQQGGEVLAGTSVTVPFNMMLALRIGALEKYLDNEAQRKEDEAPRIVGLQ